MLGLDGTGGWLTAPPAWLLAPELPGCLLFVGAGGWGLLRLLPGAPVLRVRTLAAQRRRPEGGGRATRARAALHHLLDSVLGRARARRRRATIELCRGLATELRAGRP
ncbi:hypothetical protein F4561_005515, partial [Lipingzhangella halophila]|nr:hypothetical protein [Lipingzhangella halophila]